MNRTGKAGNRRAWLADGLRWAAAGVMGGISLALIRRSWRRRCLVVPCASCQLLARCPWPAQRDRQPREREES